MIKHNKDKNNGYDPPPKKKKRRKKNNNNGICHLIYFTISTSCKAKV